MQLLRLTQADPFVEQASALRPQVGGLLRDLVDVLIHQLDLVLRAIQIESGAERQDPADHRDGSDHAITDQLAAALMPPPPVARSRAAWPSGHADWRQSPPLLDEPPSG